MVLGDKVPKGVERLHNLQVGNTRTYHMGITLTYSHISARKHTELVG